MRCDPVGEPGQARTRPRRGTADAVVGHCDDEVLAIAYRPDGDPGCPGMLHRIGECFAGDKVRGCLYRRRCPVRAGGEFDLRLEAPDEIVQGGGKAFIEAGRAHSGRQPAQVGDGLSDLTHRTVEGGLKDPGLVW